MLYINDDGFREAALDHVSFSDTFSKKQDRKYTRARRKGVRCWLTSMRGHFSGLEKSFFLACLLGLAGNSLYEF